MFRLIFGSSLAAVSSRHRTSHSIFNSFRPWRVRGYWFVAAAVTLTCTSPSGQLLGGYSLAAPQDMATIDLLSQSAPQDIEPSHPHLEQSKRLEAQGRLQAARQHAVLHLEAAQTPAALMHLARLDWLRGAPRSSLEWLRESLARHHDASSGGPAGWGQPSEVAETLFLLIPLEDELGLVDEARRHAEQLFELDVEGRVAGLTCLPALQHMQRHASASATLDIARRCEEKASILAKVLGAAYRGEAELALGRLRAAEQALADAETAHLRLIEDLGPDLHERPFARAAELALAQLRGKLNLLAGERPTGAVQLRDLVDRLQARPGIEGWLIGRQRLQEIGRMADRTGQFSLAIASARALDKLSLPGSVQPRDPTAGSDPVRELEATTGNWVVWTER